MSVILPLASFIAAFLVLLPLPGHWRARNVPTISIIVWLFAINIIHGVNSIAWAHNVDLKLLVWCDIVTRITTGGNIALPAACFCLCLHLERVASVRAVQTSFADKRKKIIIDIAVCWVVPLVYIALYYIVQGHRFDIIEDLGCRSEEYVSVVEFCLVWLPPILFALATFALAGLSLLHFFRRRATFARHLASAGGGLSPSRYFRLMSMSIVLMIWTLLVVIATCWFNYRPGLRPWTNWDDVHSNFSRVGRFPLILIQPTLRSWAFFLWFVPFITAILFVAFFAFGKDAMDDYRMVFTICTPCLKRTKGLRNKFTMMSSHTGSATIPMFVKPPPYQSTLAQSEQTLTPKSPFIGDIKTPNTPSTALSDNSSFTTSALSYYDHYLSSQSQEPLPTSPTFSYTHNHFSSPNISSPDPAYLSHEDRLARHHYSV